MKIEKNKIIEKSLVLAQKCADKLDLSIVSVDYVLENGIKILRIIASSKDGLTIDQASELNQLISDKLDSENYIDEEYYLEVSSEGIEKELRNEQDIINAVGKYVYIKLYEKINNIKDVYGDLENYQEGILRIKYNDKGKIKFLDVAKEKISKIRLAVKF